ncbi:MAG: DUF389 domain-containing protein, partial [Gemmatimonadota bacterium]
MSLIGSLKQRLALHAETDARGTVQRISAGAALSPENLWMLGASAVLASIGLDVGSAAVVIGAMLISPLMGPILGVGLGLGVTDRALIQGSLRELGLATVLVLTVSAVYFLLSPLASPTTELLARTRPTLLDVGVAFFGGIAGIVAGSRKQPSLAIPGVAIATALMPPLCTAGFGLATGHWPYFFSALYLYGLNAVFIALSTFLMVRLLRFPHHDEATAEARRRERRLVAIVTVVAALPSAYFLYDVARGVRELRRITTFVEREVEAPDRAVPQWEHHHGEGPEVLKIYIAGRPIEGAAVESLQATLPRYRLDGMRLELVQSGVSAEELRRFRGEVQLQILRAASASSMTRDSIAADRLRRDSLMLAAAAREVASTFPEIIGLAYAPRADLLAPDSVPSVPAVFVTFAPRTRPSEQRVILVRSQA